MIRKAIISFAIFFLMCLAISVVSAQYQDDSGPAIKTIDGKVVSVNAPNSQLTVSSVEDIVFSVPSGAKITNKDGFDMQLADVRVGNYAMVDYYDNASGGHIAKNINIEYNR